MVIHCDTEEKADKLLNAFDKLGKKWSSYMSYLDSDYYSIYKQNTCYSNDNHYSHYNWYKENGYKIFEFDEVDLEN